MVSQSSSNGAEHERQVLGRVLEQGDSIAYWFEHRCEKTPNKIAVVDVHTGERCTYRELALRARRLALVLQHHGIGAEDRVAVLLLNQVEMVDALLACRLLGSIAVPMNWRLAESELNEIVRDCSPKVLLYDGTDPSLAVISEAIQGDTIERLDVSIPLYAQADVSYEQRVNAGDKTMDEAAAEIAVGVSTVEHVQPGEAIAQASIRLADPWLMIYTGGTTGKPKGVVLSHGSVFWNAANTVISWQLNELDVTATILPMFHTGGINALTLPMLMAGGTVVLVRSFQANDMVRLLREERCTIVLMVPTMYHLLVQCDSFQNETFPNMRTFLSGGAPCPLPVYEAFHARGLPFKEGYGATESGPNNFVIEPEAARAKPGSVGMPMLLGEARIIDNGGYVLEKGQVGELALRGGHLFSHYWNNPQATEAAMRDGWFLTGDLARRDEEGYYYIVGRKKDMIITGGENVYPLEVEQILESHPKVLEAAVLGIADPKWGEVVVAAVGTGEAAQLTEEELKQFCLARIGKYKVPKRFVLAEELPKTVVGKLDKKEMKVWFGG
ncbi:class I adenylate-forming enzyme family protein [Paenibacillus alvei]|uniref:AMP-binding protein n=1 Tax=Paenibacillus alvei TaxID=44250 RepID=A0AAP7A260_PAEAL|nr:AMP-binding protein [Paenibacillus alvei]MBG9734690.1 long-chain fatty acid--CoA ligase [Paenibacillus alvei]MBG9742999.1 long-chain fatty acid--CoA ligase [Paenibacillus alvei]MCY9582137.1 AMP-binding protein [Paenibacillus alvei]MCY9587635.1 AMP-binding protein [Paenibacillus alvei]NOJ71458.1 AMP-binding protein [Paenibacillus alvei]